MTSLFHKWALICLLCLYHGAGFSQPLVQLEQHSSEPFNLIPFSEIYRTTDALDVQEVASKIVRGELQKAINTASQGFSKDYYWIAFSLSKSDQIGEYILEIDNPHIDEIALYQFKEKWEKIGFGGDRGRTFQERSYLNRRYVFPLLAEQEKTNYLIMIDKRNASVSFPLRLWDKKAYLDHEAKLNLIYGIYFGVLFFVSMLSMLFGLVLRQRVLILYGAYALAMVLYQFTALGFSYQFLYPYSTSFNNYSRLVLIVLISVLSILFTRAFLDLDKHAPKTSTALKIINYLLLALFASWLFFFDLFTVYTIWIINAIYVLVICIFLLSLLGIKMAYPFKRKQAIAYLAAFGVLILACCLYIGIEYGIFNESLFIINPIMFGSGLEIIILALFMSYWAKNLIQKTVPVAAVVPSVPYITVYRTSPQRQPEISHQSALEVSPTTDSETNWLEFKDHQKVDQDEISHIKSDGHYLLLYSQENKKPIFQRMTFKEAEAQLTNSFLRTHRSFMVNKNWIAKYNSTQITLKDGIQLPLSRTYKEAFFESMEEN